MRAESRDRTERKLYRRKQVRCGTGRVVSALLALLPIVGSREREACFVGLRVGACGLDRSAVIGERGVHVQRCVVTPTAARARCSKAVVGREAGRCAHVAWVSGVRVYG